MLPQRKACTGSRARIVLSSQSFATWPLRQFSRAGRAVTPCSIGRSLVGHVFALVLGLLLGLPYHAHGSTTPLMGATAQRGGATNVVWTPSAQASVDITLTGSTLATGKFVELWMYLPSRAPFTQTTPVEPPDAPSLKVEMLGRSANLSLQWTGWRRLVIPVSVMKVTSGSYNVSNKLRLSRDGNFASDFIINYCGGSVATQVTGIGLEDEDLLDHIDLSLPGMAAVNSAVQTALGSSGAARATAVGQAKTALAAYFRQNFTTRWPMGTGKTTEADVLVNGTFTYVGNTYTYPFINGEVGAIDWNFNPTLQPEHTGADTYEWGYSMHRFGHWDTLTTAYNSNTPSKENYAAFWAGNLRSWIAQESVPAINDESNTSGWRGLDTGLRLSKSWPASFFAFSQSTASVSDADIILFLKSIVEHGNYLSGHLYGPGNHFILAMCGLVTQGGVFPELKDAWRAAKSSAMRAG